MFHWTSEGAPPKSGQEVLEDGEKRFRTAAERAKALGDKIEDDARGVAAPQLTVPSANAELAQLECDLKRCHEWAETNRSLLSDVRKGHLHPPGGDTRNVTFEDLWLPEPQGGGRPPKRLDLVELRSGPGRAHLQNAEKCLRLVAVRLAWIKSFGEGKPDKVP